MSTRVTQEKAWVDKEVMMKIATKFVDRKNEKHGEDIWVLLFCDNSGMFMMMSEIFLEIIKFSFATSLQE